MAGQKGVFLDRDGVLNKAYGHRPPNTPEELVLLPGVAEAVRDLKESEFKVFVVTNQGGVGLGYMTEEELGEIHAELLRKIRQSGGDIDEIKACTHKPKANCACRKPKPGMLLDLAEKHNIDLAQSFMVGDREMDIEAGLAAGATTILLERDKTDTKADYVVDDLTQAASLIKQQS